MSEVALRTQNTEIIEKVEMQTITEYLDSTGLTKQLLPNEKAMFVNMAQGFGLNPFKREIYCTVYGEGQYRQCSIVTGYEVYLKRAERIGKLDGWQVSVTGSIKDQTLAATVTIHRKDWQHPFQHTAYYIECVQKNKQGQPNKVWAKMPIFMTKKVAIAQAFRLCFSDEFGGMPYTNDELNVEPQEMRNVTEPVQEQVQEQVQAPVDNRQALIDIIEKHEEALKGKPLELSVEALNANDPVKITEMYNRCIAYLGKKGINV